MNEAGAVYGQALYDLAQEEGLTEIIWQQLQTLQQCLEAEPDYLSLLSTPSCPSRTGAGCWTRAWATPIRIC